MSDLLKLLKLLTETSKPKKNETQEEMIRRIVSEQFDQQSQTGAAASPASPDVTQNLLKLLNFQVENAMAEKSELVVEKAKRLQAELEAEVLKKKLEEMKTSGGVPDQRKVDGMEKKLHDLGSTSSKSDDVEKLVHLLQALKNSESLNSDTKLVNNSNINNEKSHDPAWFPAASAPDNFSVHSVNNPLDKNLFNQRLASGPPSYDSIFSNQQHQFSGNAGNSPRHNFPPNQLPTLMAQPLLNTRPQNYDNMNNFHRPQFTFRGDYNNIYPPPCSMQFHRPMLMNQRFNRPPHNGNRNFHRPNFAQGPDQVRFTQNKHQNQQKNKNKQSQPSQQHTQSQLMKKKCDQPKQMNQSKPVNQHTENNQNEAKKNPKSKKKTSQENDLGNSQKNQSQNATPNSVNLTSEDLQNVKQALNSKKKDNEAKQTPKTAFKKKKNPKANQPDSGESPEDDDDDSDTSNNNAAPKPLPRKSKQEESQNPDAAQNVGGAKKKDTAGSAKKTRPPKKKNNKNTDQQKASPAYDHLNLFIGDRFPTLTDIETGRLKLITEVKEDILMIAKVGEETITEKPKIVQDMILFHHKYPNAKLIILQ